MAQSQINRDPHSRKRSRLFQALGIFLGVSVVAAISLSQGPDFELRLERKIPSRLSPERLNRNLEPPSRWSQWFHSLARVEGPELIQKGAHLVLKVDPKKGARKRFELNAQVIEFIPNQLVHLSITGDSSERLSRLFEHLEWKIRIEPTPNGSLIHATATAHTRSWRARLLGRLAEKIVMNQVFYPNIIQLAELSQPFTVDEAPHRPPNSM